MTMPRWMLRLALTVRALDPTLTFSRERLQKWMTDRDALHAKHELAWLTTPDGQVLAEYHEWPATGVPTVLAGERLRTQIPALPTADEIRRSWRDTVLPAVPSPMAAPPRGREQVSSLFAAALAIGTLDLAPLDLSRLRREWQIADDSARTHATAMGLTPAEYDTVVLEEQQAAMISPRPFSWLRVMDRIDVLGVRGQR